MTPNEALQIAKRLFLGEKDRHGLPLVEHSVRVGASLSGSAQVVAYLHDVLEDTGVGVEYLRERGLSPLQERALDGVTRRKAETYREFIERICTMEGQAGILARQVKLADLEDNMSRGELPETKSMIANRYWPAHDRISKLVEQDAQENKTSSPLQVTHWG